MQNFCAIISAYRKDKILGVTHYMNLNGENSNLLIRILITILCAGIEAKVL